MLLWITVKKKVSLRNDSAHRYRPCPSTRVFLILCLLSVWAEAARREGGRLWAFRNKVRSCSGSSDCSRIEWFWWRLRQWRSRIDMHLKLSVIFFCFIMNKHSIKLTSFFLLFSLILSFTHLLYIFWVTVLKIRMFITPHCRKWFRKQIQQWSEAQAGVQIKLRACRTDGKFLEEVTGL